MVSKVRKSYKTNFNRQSIITLASMALGLLNIMEGDPILLIVAVAGVATYFLYSYYGKSQSKSIILVAGLTGVFAFCWLGLWLSPAQAQFFLQAEDFFDTSLEIDSATVDFVFFTIRAVFLLYLVVAFLNVFNSVRQDDDWLQAARTPALVLLFFTAADFLTQFILTGAN